MFVTEDLTAKTTVMRRSVKNYQSNEINWYLSLSLANRTQIQVIDIWTTAKIHPSCKYLSFILGGINLTELGRAPMDFEGTLTGTEPCSSDNCELNTIMRVQMLPLRDKFRLELSFSSNPNRDQLDNTLLFHRYIHPHFQGFRFKSKFTNVCNQYISEI